ncbi:DsbA family protein [Pajaroellobacter abortibovis]|nr:thioredoxin domain-containing protein [Pajaroellobacter abortibovis]
MNCFSASSGQGALADAAQEERGDKRGNDPQKNEKLTLREQNAINKLLESKASFCPQPNLTIKRCIEENEAYSKLCLLAKQYIENQVREGFAVENVEQLYKERFDPAYKQNIPLDGSPIRGPEDAPITLVDFADFKCFACRKLVPLFKQMIEMINAEHPTPIIREVHKFVTFAGGDEEARFILGIREEQGNERCWQARDTLFQESKSLDSYAQELGFDWNQTKKRMWGGSINDRIQEDKRLLHELGIMGVPTFYINGRLFKWFGPIPQSLQKHFRSWIELELQILAETKKFS